MNSVDDVNGKRDPSRSDEAESVAPDPGNGARQTVTGTLAVAIGVLGVVVFFGRPAPSDEAAGFATWNTAIIIASAAFMGFGLYSLMRGVAHRRRRGSARSGS